MSNQPRSLWQAVNITRGKLVDRTQQSYDIQICHTSYIINRPLSITTSWFDSLNISLWNLLACTYYVFPVLLFHARTTLLTCGVSENLCRRDLPLIWRNGTMTIRAHCISTATAQRTMKLAYGGKPLRQSQLHIRRSPGDHGW